MMMMCVLVSELELRLILETRVGMFLFVDDVVAVMSDDNVSCCVVDGCVWLDGDDG